MRKFYKTVILLYLIFSFFLTRIEDAVYIFGGRSDDVRMNDLYRLGRLLSGGFDSFCQFLER